MSKYIVDLELDGYETDEEREEAGLIFIEEQLDFSGSSVKAVKLTRESLLRELQELDNA